MSQLEPLPPPTAPTEEEWGTACDLLLESCRRGQPVAIAAHVTPDGDALGSALALGLALCRAGVGMAPVVSFDPGSVPFRVPPTLSFLPGQDLLVPPTRFPLAPGLLVTMDTGSADRLGLLAPAVSAAQHVLVIDHHASNTRFGSHQLLNTAAASTTELVAELIWRLGVRLDSEIATALYTGLVTDTGSFRYAGTSPTSHRLAARLLEAGVKHDDIARQIWDTRPFGYLQVLGVALSRVRLEGKLVWTWIGTSDLSEAGVTPEDIESVIDVVRTAQESEVAAVFKEDADGSWKVSTRSRGLVDVGAACTALGGGGHRFAAGFTSSRGLDETMAALREALAIAPVAESSPPAAESSPPAAE